MPPDETNAQRKFPAVFLDRDGTLMEDVDYCHDPRAVRVFPDAVASLERWRQAGFKNIVITNQSGIARGRVTTEQYHSVNKALLDQLGAENIAAVYFCPDFSERRKPAPAMVLEAAHDFDLDLARSFFIGDKASDIACGRAAGVRTILVETGYGRQQPDARPDFIAKDLAAAADYILDIARAHRP